MILKTKSMGASTRNPKRAHNIRTEGNDRLLQACHVEKERPESWGSSNMAAKNQARGAEKCDGRMKVTATSDSKIEAFHRYEVHQVCAEKQKPAVADKRCLRKGCRAPVLVPVGLVSHSDRVVRN